MASLVQDVWLGATPRLRGRRLAPYEDARVRVVFQPDLGATLDDPDLAAFREALAARVDVVAFEARGQGGSGGRFGPEALDDLVDLLASAPRRWPDGLPVIVAGHGLGGTLALAAAGKATAAAALAPSLGGFLGAVELARQLQVVRVPLLALIPRGDAASAPVAQILEGVKSAALLAVPGDGRGLLRSPWVQLLAEWARHPPAAPP
jgi:alpha-beta hydrolase superfamily lysophospholipase